MMIINQPLPAGCWWTRRGLLVDMLAGQENNYLKLNQIILDLIANEIKLGKLAGKAI